MRRHLKLVLTFPATDFAASVLRRHVPLYAGVQHSQQDVHAGKGLGLSDSSLPLLYRCRYLRGKGPDVFKLRTSHGESLIVVALFVLIQHFFMGPCYLWQTNFTKWELCSLTLASSASLFSSSTSSALLLSSPPCLFFFFCLGAMNPWRNFLITQAWIVMMHSPKSFKFSMSFNCEERMKQTQTYYMSCKVSNTPLNWVASSEFNMRINPI